MAVSQERVVGLERQRGEQQQEERRLRERLIAAQQQIIDLEEQCDQADEALDTDALLNCANDAERRRLSVRPTGALAAASDIIRG